MNNGFSSKECSRNDHMVSGTSVNDPFLARNMRFLVNFEEKTE
jgi:hypothetical protein